MFAFVIGELLSYIKKNKTVFFLKISNSVILTPVIAIVYFLSFYIIVQKHYLAKIQFLFDEFLFSILSVIIIARCVGEGYKYFGKWLLENDSLKHLGQISYGLYLFHLFATPVFYDYISPELQLFTKNKETSWWLFFLFTWLAAEISYRIIEKPINSLKKYFKY